MFHFFLLQPWTKAVKTRHKNISGFAQVMENLKSLEIYEFHFRGLESPGN